MIFKHATCFNTKLTEFLLTFVCYALSFYSATTSGKQTFLNWKVRVLGFYRTLSRPFVYVHSHTCLSFMLVVIGLLGSCSMHLQMCSFTLISSWCCCYLLVYFCNKLSIVVALAFVYCFHVNDIRSFCVTIFSGLQEQVAIACIMISDLLPNGITYQVTYHYQIG